MASMFCPKCGTADQTPETFCRQCGGFLPDFTKPVKKSQTPQDHVRANLFLNALTIAVSFTLAILLFTILAFKPDTHPLIHLTVGLLIAMGFWHTQTLWRSILLRRHFKREVRAADIPRELDTNSSADAHQLSEPDFENFVPASVTDRTTRSLDKVEIKSPQSQDQSD